MQTEAVRDKKVLQPLFEQLAIYFAGRTGRHAKRFGDWKQVIEDMEEEGWRSGLKSAVHHMSAVGIFLAAAWLLYKCKGAFVLCPNDEEWWEW